ncbi:DarT ssDNA thymidine ADP-ribosyltransferase family protein [Rhodoferax sp.]|uniref:DarT ssDNA thymidine ADP-ribosyltransferase family protein n=1 Tax=Rhodoferax sp. TaxID=50421 RepID=UPI002ACD8347|nr:DarT ssDNA thymidine ADP-ribosyltransferase family protein [Rhodoferax sp.]MDZ7921881.1 DarT ssDNA thymidine ADP-ribosyltransferase family protein [Rhodoferax sp.]
MADYKSKKLIYHLTALKNIPSILEKGLLPRNQLTDFQDVADMAIIEKRQGLVLEGYVPFHWFVNNPFDGIIQRTYRDTSFALIAVKRELAARKNWKFLPRHPLANSGMELLDYAAGFEAIDWETMNQRDYHDPNCKSVCMAECLAPGSVPVSQFFAIYVRDTTIERKVRTCANRHGVTVGIDVNENMFLR